MHRRPAHLLAITLTAAAALTLSACGSEDAGPRSKDNDKIAGADTGTETSASPTETAPAPVGGRPRIELPSDLSYTFDWPKTGDKDKDAVLADGEQSIKALDLAIVNQDALDPAYLHYYEAAAAAGAESFIQGYLDDKVSITGSYRFYDAVVAVDTDGTASLSYCEDQGKAYVKDLATQKAKLTPVDSNSYVIYHTSLKKNAKGIWAIQTIDAERGSAKCQP
ncbi:hypothetical protein [Streptomyces sp. NPDC003832]